MILLCEHPAPCGMRERPINTCGLACADQGQPRAALEANDLWIRLRWCAASSRVVRLTYAPPWPRLSASDDSGADTVCERLPSPLACTSFCSPVSPVSVSSQLTCCQLGWRSHPI